MKPRKRLLMEIVRSMKPRKRLKSQFCIDRLFISEGMELPLLHTLIKGIRTQLLTLEIKKGLREQS